MAISTRRATGVFWLLACLLLLAVHLSGGLAQADDKGTPPATQPPSDADPEGDTDSDQPGQSPLVAASPTQVKDLTAKLKKVVKKKNANDVLPTLAEIESLADPAFNKLLLKFVKHSSSLVATKAAAMWEWRVGGKKERKKLWKASWGEKKNHRRYELKARVLVALARAGHVLDARQYREVESDWRWMLTNPNPKLASALAGICRYFELTKDKRHCRRMAEELDDPCINVSANDPSAQPLEWQERRWKLWHASKPAMVAALKALTGQEFDKTEQAETWFKAHEKSFGFKW